MKLCVRIAIKLRKSDSIYLRCDYFVSVSYVHGRTSKGGIVMWKTHRNGTSIVMIMIIYEERWESMWEMSIQIVHKAIHSKQTGGYNDRGNITRGVARKTQ